MKLETSPKVTKSKRSLHWCRSISKKYLCTFYYSISQKVITLSGRRFITVSGVLLHYRTVITLSGVFYYIIGQLLQYRAFITLSVGTSAMSMAKNVSRVCQMAYCQLRSIARIRRSITTTACRTIVHALVMLRLDCCNAVLYGLPDAQLQKLQLVQNAAARLVTGTHRREHITPVLFALHWLPIRQRIQFKLLLLVYRCIHQLAPAYLIDLVVPYVPARSLRSAEQNLLTVKRYNLERFGRRSFSVAGPSLWNALPSAIRNSMSLSAFRSSLKTHLFREAFATLL